MTVTNVMTLVTYKQHVGTAMVAVKVGMTAALAICVEAAV